MNKMINKIIWLSLHSSLYMTLKFDILVSLICNNINVWTYVSGQNF